MRQRRQTALAVTLVAVGIGAAVALARWIEARAVVPIPRSQNPEYLRCKKLL